MEFYNEYDFLVHLAVCALRDDTPNEMPKKLSFAKVFNYALAHDIANIAFESVALLEQKPEEDLYRAWEQKCDMALIRDINQRFARDEILSEFEKEKIRSLEVQGSKIKELYPKSEYRTMSDIDFIIDRENLGISEKILEKLGYSCQHTSVEVDGFRPPNINIELHSEYFPESSEYYSVMRPPFSSVEENGEYSVSELYIYNMLHIAKHFHNRGCGIRRVFDVWYLNERYKDVIDREYVMSVFEKSGERDFVKKITSLAEDWFLRGITSVENRDMAKYIFESTLHGNEKNYTQNRIVKKASKGKLSYLKTRLFPSKAVLQARYPVLKKYPVLLPFCWLLRFFSAIFTSGKRVATELFVALAKK